MTSQIAVELEATKSVSRGSQDLNPKGLSPEFISVTPAILSLDHSYNLVIALIL